MVIIKGKKYKKYVLPTGKTLLIPTAKPKKTKKRKKK